MDKVSPLLGPMQPPEVWNLRLEAELKLMEYKTSQELRMPSSVTINCQITKIVMNSGSQLSEIYNIKLAKDYCKAGKRLILGLK